MLTKDGQETIYKNNPSNISEEVSFDGIEIKNPIKKGMGKNLSVTGLEGELEVN
jgi:hypothetical protein